MSALRDYYDWHPTHEQELLLQAALLHGQPAKEAWKEWCASCGPGDLDPGTARLLPLLGQNLKKEGLEQPAWAGQIRKAYRETWAKNQLLFHRAVPILISLQEAGIKTLVLKGVSLVSRYYQDAGLRPMNDFDFLVPTEQAVEAIRLLRKLGWQPALRNPERSLQGVLSVNYALHFSSPDHCDVDLHWHVLNECLGPLADLDFWEAAVPFEVNGWKTLGLNPADELLHTCLHGARWNKMPPIRWVADAVTILQSGTAVDWGRLSDQAVTRRLTLPVEDALHYLSDRFDVSIPEKLWKELSNRPVSKEERREYRTRTSRPGWSSYIPFMWAYYPRIARDSGRSPGVRGFVGYLQNFWELEHAWQVPLYALWRSVKRLFGLPSDG